MFISNVDNLNDVALIESDGYYYIEGSANRFVKIFGNRISLDSIEEIIINKGFESAATGYDDKLLIYVIHNNNLLTDLLRSDISAEIGINQTAIQISAVSEFPRLNNGKINYNGLTNIQ